MKIIACLVFLFLFPLYCLSFSDIKLLNTALVSVNFYYPSHHLLCIVATEFMFFWYLYIFMHTCVTQLSYQIICNKRGVSRNCLPYQSWLLGFSGVPVAQSLVFCVVFWRSLLVLFSFIFCHCIICPSLI